MFVWSCPSRNMKTLSDETRGSRSTGAWSGSWLPVDIVGAVERGDVLYRAGASLQNFFVILEGEVEVVRRAKVAKRLS
jgi:CRP-like cAMP-binding protein